MKTGCAHTGPRLQVRKPSEDGELTFAHMSRARKIPHSDVRCSERKTMFRILSRVIQEWITHLPLYAHAQRLSDLKHFPNKNHECWPHSHSSRFPKDFAKYEGKLYIVLFTVLKKWLLLIAFLISSVIFGKLIHTVFQKRNSQNIALIKYINIRSHICKHPKCG